MGRPEQFVHRGQSLFLADRPPPTTPKMTAGRQLSTRAPPTEATCYHPHSHFLASRPMLDARALLSDGLARQSRATASNPR